MRELNMPLASPIGAQVITPISININLKIPDLKTIDGVRNYYDHQAQRLADALISALPQGIIEPLMIKLMQQRISLYCKLMEVEK